MIISGSIKYPERVKTFFLNAGKHKTLEDLESCIRTRQIGLIYQSHDISFQWSGVSDLQKKIPLKYLDWNTITVDIVLKIPNDTTISIV